MSVALRALVPADAELLAALHKLGFEEHWSAESFAALIASPGVFGVLAGTKEPLGFILCRAVAGESEILTVFVPEAHRRAGVGGALVERALVEAREQAARSVFLEVAEDNKAARRLYRRHGFTEVGRRPRYYKGTIDALILRRDLGASW